MEKGFTEKRKIILSAGFFVLFPLVMTDGYSNVSVTKIGCFGILVLPFFFLICWETYRDYVKEKKGFTFPDLLLLWKKMNGVDRFMAFFLLAQILAYAFAKYKAVAFDGRTDTHMGFFFFLLLVASYAVAKKEIGVNRMGMDLITAGMDGVVLFALWQFLGGDPFGMLARLQTDHPYNYLSTFGNTAIFGMFLTLTIPVCGWGYCTSERQKRRIFYGISSGIGLLGVLISNTDATYLGFACVTAIFLMVLPKKPEWMRHLLELLGIYGASLLVFRWGYPFFENARSVSAMVRTVVGLPIGWYFGGLGFLAAVWCRMRFGAVSEKFCRGLTVVFRIAILAAGALALGIFFYFSVIDRVTGLGTLEAYLRFRPEWGTDRGYVWGWLFSIFKKAGVLQKLFGFGQGSIFLELMSVYGKEMVEGLGYVFDNAHNVYLHALVTWGLFGCVTYIGLLAAALREKRRMSEDGECLSGALKVAIAACGIQQIVSIMEPGTLPILFLYLGMLSGCGDGKEQKKPSGTGKYKKKETGKIETALVLGGSVCILLFAVSVALLFGCLGT